MGGPTMVRMVKGFVELNDFPSALAIINSIRISHPSETVSACSILMKQLGKKQIDV